MNAILDEHQEYLALSGRFEKYASAIARTVKPGDVVADLGCGVGVLGLQCLQAGASHVYGIDHSGAIEIARETMRRAGLADRYSCLAGSTFTTQLPQPVDLIICDHVGFFGFDYGITEMLADGRKRFLKPGGEVMPRRIRLMLAGAEAMACRTRADFWESAAVPPEYHWLGEHGRNSRHRFGFSAADLCTASECIGEIDFRSDQPDLLSFSARLDVTRAARFDGLAGWFECELAPDVWMTNSPLDPDPIERPNAFLSAAEPFDVTSGDVIEVTIRIRRDADTIAWTIQPPGAAPRQKLSTWKSRVFGSLDLAATGDVAASLTPSGRALGTLLQMVDGQRSRTQIEEAMLASHATDFASAEQLREFVRRELARNARVDTPG
jgi:type I protein arginine methyltransferase